MTDINWNQKRRIFRNTETDELYVAIDLPGSVMEIDDYIQGGQVQLRKHCEPLVLVGTYTNAQIDAGIDD